MSAKTKDKPKTNGDAKAGAAATATVNLAAFVENPDNPSVATDEDIARLAGKLKRVPLGLTAMRIAYVTDREDGGCAGKRVVISGNKRLRVLKQAFGENGEVPAEWFADVTAMSEAERHEFIVSANVSDGAWDVDKLLAQYDRGELAELMKADELDALLADIGGCGDDNAETDGDSDGEINAETGFTYKEQFGVIVMCKDEHDQEQIYKRLVGEGFDCKVVAT